MRIVEIETFGRGGLIHYAYNLSCALADRGHEVTLITAADYELEDRSLPANVRLVKAIGRRSAQAAGRRFARWRRKLDAIFDAVRVARQVRRLRPDVVHLHCTNPVALVYLTLLRLTRLPLVQTAHVVTPHEPIPLQTAVYRRIHRRCDLIVAHSEFDRRRLESEFRVAANRLAVIPHGEYGFFERGGEPVAREEARSRLGLAPDAEVVLFFGYIREYKGLDILLQSWSDVAAARPQAQLVIAGDPVQLGDERRTELESWAERLGAIHRFAYIPFSDVATYFGAADALVMPYRHISQSGVLYLALSLGLPVVATSVGALVELLEESESALLVPPESPSELAAALVRVLGDPALRERLAAGGRSLARRHSWPAIAERTETAFAQLAPDAESRPPPASTTA